MKLTQETLQHCSADDELAQF